MAQAKKTQSKKKPTAKKATARKTTAKKPAAKKATARKPTVKKATPRPKPTPKPAAAPAPAAPAAPPGEHIGDVTHYFDGISVAAIGLTGTLSVGDKISIRRADDYLEQTVDSMQIDRQDVQSATAGQEIGIKVTGKVHEHNKVYKV